MSASGCNPPGRLGLGVRFPGPTHLVLLARTESEAQQAWERLQSQFAALRLVVNQEKSRVTTVEEGFAFLGFEFRKPPARLRYMWPRKESVPTYPGSGTRSGPIVSR